VDEGLVFDAEDFKSAGPEVRGMAEMYLHEIANTHARELSTWLTPGTAGPRSGPAPAT
jgi:hypothetical protein